MRELKKKRAEIEKGGVDKVGNNRRSLTPGSVRKSVSEGPLV